MQERVLAEGLQYIGVNDTTIDLFESQYEVPDGISYNSYLIMDDQIAVMDSVDKRCVKEWFTNLEATLGQRQPDYLVVQHMEPDHSGSVQLFLEQYPQAKLVCSERAVPMLAQFFPMDISNRCRMVREGEELSLGHHVLTFVMAPMVHWPEVMMTYDKTEKTLFSADAFGKFGVSDGEEDDWLNEARRYYINIVGKYGPQVQALLKKAKNLDIQMLCPLHGPVLRDNLPFYLEKYNLWSSYEPEQDGIVIAYASIYGNTAAAAWQLANMLKELGAPRVAVYDLAREDMAKVVAEAFRYSKLVVACPTYDGGLFPCMETFLAKLRSKNYQKRMVGIIENGTWAPMAGRVLKEQLSAMREIKVLEPLVTVRSTLKEDSEGKLQQLAAVLATT